MAGDDAAVVAHAIQPGVHVVDDPPLVFPIAREQEGIGRQRRGRQVQEMIADDVGVFLVMRQELRERRLTVLGVEPAHVERIADPIERRRLPQHRPATAVLHAADDLALRVVVRRVWILGHVEPGEPARARLIGRILRDRQPHPIEQLQASP